MRRKHNLSMNRLVIEAGKTERAYWSDLWRYRELFFFLSWRDILVRYKQTVIGVLWALIKPLLTIAIFTILFGKMAGLMAWYHVVPTWRLATLPLFTGLGLGAALGIGFWLAALNVKYRDFRYVIPFVVQFGFFVSPVGYPSSWCLDKLAAMKHGDILQWIYLLNPMVGVIDGFRWAILGTGTFPWFSLSLSIFIGFLFFLGGAYTFQRVESRFADVV